MSRTLSFARSRYCCAFLTASTGICRSFFSEMQIAGAKASDEFVEMYNTGDTATQLSGYSLRRKSAGDVTATGSSLKTFSANDNIPAHGYFLWANSASLFKDHADATTGSSLADNNSLALYDKNDTLVDSLTWGTGHLLPFSPTQFGNPEGKEGFTRDLGTLVWSLTNNPTPMNSKGELFLFTDEKSSTEIGPSPYSILINEVLPNPKEKGDAGEFIELYNPSGSAVDLSGWEIRDASATGKYIFPTSTEIPSLGYLVITDQEFSLSLNNSNETLSLFDREKRLVHQVRYEKTKAGVSLNLVSGMLRGSRVPTPGTKNSENADPVTKERVPKKGYKNFAIDFRAKGKDRDGDKLKFTWDFGDRHKSYKESTSHKYEKSGRYTVTLTTDDGIDTMKETFDIKIEKYTAPKVRIVAFMPNPKGNDSDLEWIEIENREKKEVNLRGFSIATGTKKKSIANHPIREEFVVAPKSVKRLTRTHSLFTLGNERGHIELRAPDGKVIQHLKYKFDKGLADDTVLKKEKGQSLSLVELKTERVTDSESLTDSSETSRPNEDSMSLPAPVEIPAIPPSEEIVPDGVPASRKPVEEEKIDQPDEPHQSLTIQSAPNFHLPDMTLPFSSFWFDSPEHENTLTYWQGVVNAYLNDWLSETMFATTESE